MASCGGRSAGSPTLTSSISKLLLLVKRPILPEANRGAVASVTVPSFSPSRYMVSVGPTGLLVALLPTTSRRTVYQVPMTGFLLVNLQVLGAATVPAVSLAISTRLGDDVCMLRPAAYQLLG